MLIDTWKSRREPIIHNHVYRVSQRPRAATSDAIRDARKRPRDSFKQEAATRPIHHPVTVQQSQLRMINNANRRAWGPR